MPRYEFEFPFESTKGTRWFAISVNQRVNRGAVVAHTDITSRKLAESAVERHVARLSIALASAEMGVWNLDLDTGTVVWSNECYVIFGLEQFGGTRDAFRELVHPEDRDKMRAAFEKEIAARGVFEGEFRIVRPDGEIRWVSNRCQVQDQEGGPPRNIIGTVRDITKRKQAEQELLASEQRYRLFVDSTRVVFWEAVLGTFDFCYVSEHCRELLGYPREKWYEHNFWYDHVHPDDRDEAMRYCTQTTQQLLDHRFKYRMIHADGREIWIDDVVTVDHKDGKVNAIRGMLIDITKEKRAHDLAVDQNRVLGLIASGTELQFILEELGILVEKQMPGAICSVLLLDRESQTLRHGGARNLPEEYSRKIDGVKIGPSVGSCGTAAYWGDFVAVSNIAEDPLWFGYAPLALEQGLMSCWSNPIFKGGRQKRIHEPDEVIGTLAVYHREVASPTNEAKELLNLAADLAGVAIERHRHLTELEEGRRRFKNVLDSLPVGVTIKNLQGEYTFVNQAAVDSIGLPRDKWLGRKACEILLPEVAAQFDRNDAIVLAANELRTFDETLYQVNGPKRQLYTMLFPLLDGKGEPYALCAVSTDVTERHQIEETLRQAQKIARLGNWSYDIRNEQVRASEEARRICNWDDRDHRLDELFHLLHPDDRELVIHNWNATLRGELYDVEHRFRMDGRIVWVDVHGIPIKDAFGEVIGITGIIQDITDRKCLEVNLAHAQKLEAVGLLAGGIAHDFNNILTVILGACEFLFRTNLNPEQTDWTSEIRSAGERAKDLTAQLLASSRQQILVHSVSDLNEIVRQSTGILKRCIGEHIQLQIDLADDLYPVRMELQQISRVLINLSINAQFAMPKGGQLLISTRNLKAQTDCTENPPREMVELIVADTGVGIPSELIGQVFDPFFTTRSASGGSGLGLSVVHGVITQCGGTIDVESEVGRGTRFRILLPAELCEKPSQAVTSATASCRGTETILIVEDEPTVLNVASMALRINGYNVITATRGTTALELLNDSNLDISLILTDVVMPDMGGRDLADRVREKHPEMPVLFMSGYTDDEILRQGVYRSIDQFIQKPVETRALASKVRVMIDQFKQTGELSGAS